MAFSEKFQNLRKESGDSQTSLAEKLSVSRQAVSKWERGDSVPDVEKLMIVCNYFNVSPDYMLLDTQPKVTSDNKADNDGKSSPLGSVASFFLIGCIIGSVAVYGLLSAFGSKPAELPSDDDSGVTALAPVEPEIIEIYVDSDPISLNNFMLDNFYDTAISSRLDLLPVFSESISNITLGELLTYMRHVYGKDTFTAGEVNEFAYKHFELAGIIHEPVPYKFNYSFVDGVGTYVASAGAVDTNPIGVLKSLNSDPINNKFVAVYDIYYPADGSISSTGHQNLYDSFKASSFTNTANLTNKKTYLIGYTINDRSTDDLSDDYLIFTSVKTLD